MTIYFVAGEASGDNHGAELMRSLRQLDVDLYNQSGVRTVFVRHPMIERLRASKIDIERDPSLVALFPGSRSREVRKIFPILIEAAHKLRRRKPNLRFEVAAASDELARE